MVRVMYSHRRSSLTLALSYLLLNLVFRQQPNRLPKFPHMAWVDQENRLKTLFSRVPSSGFEPTTYTKISIISVCFVLISPYLPQVCHICSICSIFAISMEKRHVFWKIVNFGHVTSCDVTFKFTTIFRIFGQI